ncbi:MAG: hypothetical protein IT383_03600 [Deltaproteobacteria bacterium]|nr:hypothetical protein [Deltaproteobacteria bacterium]
MANNTVTSRPTTALRPKDERLDVRKSDNARNVAANGLEGLASSGAMSVDDARDVAGQLDQAITTADQAETAAKKTASPEARAQARQMAQSREAGLVAAMNARLPIEQLEASELGFMDAARVGYTAVKGMDGLVTEMENIAATRSRVGDEIAGLEGKEDRTPGEELLLEAKRQQADALDATSSVLRDRVDTLRATKDAAMNTEADGSLAFTEEETEQLRAATQATDVAAVAAATQGRGADAAVAMALEAVSQEQGAGNASRAELSASATNVPAPVEGKTLPAGDSVTVKKGDWLTKIASAHKNSDGSPVTLEQLLDTPGNEKFRAKPDLIRPGDVVKLPAGAVRAEDWKPTTTDNANAPVAPSTSNASAATKKNAGKPKLGLASNNGPKPLDAKAIDQSIARSNAQTRTLNDVRQGLLDDGVGGLDAKVDRKRVRTDADAVIARHQERKEAVQRVGGEIDAEIKDLSARPNRTPGEEALLQAKRSQRTEVDTLVSALDGNIASLEQLKVDASDGRISNREAGDIMTRYRAKQSAVQQSVQAGMTASEQLASAYDQLREG